MARNGGFGFGKLLMEQLGAGSSAEAIQRAARLPAPRAQVPAPATLPSEVPPNLEPPVAAVGLAQALPASITARTAASPTKSDAVGAARAATPEDFVARLLPDAEAAAAALGIEPRLLLAQAALETGWGAAAPQRPDGETSHNVFGIKAGAAWRGARVAQWTIEHDGGVAERRREEFRAYASTAASFEDYVDLIANTPRYAAAHASDHDPEASARAVTAAGYATDPNYADKWLAIYRGERLGSALRAVVR
jgi:flagellar protein FlgJ